MRKKISYVAMDSTLANWLLDKLSNDIPPTDSAEDLRSGLRDLLDGEVSSLVIAPSERPGIAHAAQEEIHAGEIEIYPQSRKVLMRGHEIFLTPKEFDILYFLAQNRGEVFTKEQIYQAVWSDKYLLDDSNIMAFIRKLRKKIEPAPDSPVYILTIWGIGYKFNDDI